MAAKVLSGVGGSKVMIVIISLIIVCRLFGNSSFERQTEGLDQVQNLYS